MTLTREELLIEILSQPTAPFRERHIINVATRALDAGRVPYFIDPVGNLVVGAASAREYAALAREKTDNPLRVFIAHMDHPGFHGDAWLSDTELAVRWHGGSPTAHLPGSRLWLATKEGWAGEARVVSAKMRENGYPAIESAVIRVEGGARNLPRVATALYGGFAFREPVWLDGELVYTKAADDLVGVFAILSLALDSRKKKRAPFLGILTRAEEVGFIGAIGHFRLGWLERARRPVLCVSLETSRALPGAEIGKGPVVRLGDRYTVFDPGALRVFSDLAERALPGRHQRRVMDGGTCEATAATVFGWPSVGISVPLGNYHNQSLEGGPDAAPENGPAPEFVHRGDVAGLLELCRALLAPRAPWPEPWKARRRALDRNFRTYQALLRSGP